MVGYRLRIPQIQNRLCQIKTGERKTKIVALLATIKCLQGHTVDVWTSNPILAEEGVDGTRVRVQTYGNYKPNRPTEESSHTGMCYEIDMLQGTIENFQFEINANSMSSH